VSVIPGIAFSGSLDGHLRAYGVADGATGGSLDGGGPAIVDGMLYVNSGYSLVAGRPGNLLLAFSIDGK
jgi:polyvinyl alcohol dehydrogenase (cytochrome)